MERIIGYEAASRYCRDLARRLDEQLGPELDGCQFIGIPRGGLIVLGMLSYLLRLERSQLQAGHNAEIAVVVDDCSLSGARFSAILERLRTSRIVFAHLLSHPKLRAAILAAEPRVEACLAADDLVERTDFRFGEEAQFRQRWRERLPGKRYWLGAVEPFAFAWNEPDQVLWNERSQRVEDNWHRVSPRQSIGVWADLGIPLSSVDPGPLDIPGHVRWKVDDDEVILWDSRQDRVYCLKGVACAMWRAIVGYGDLAPATQFLLGRYDVDELRLRGDLQGFVDDLLTKGLICRRDAETVAHCDVGVCE